MKQLNKDNIMKQLNKDNIMFATIIKKAFLVFESLHLKSFVISQLTHESNRYVQLFPELMELIETDSDLLVVEINDVKYLNLTDYITFLQQGLNDPTLKDYVLIKSHGFFKRVWWDTTTSISDEIEVTNRDIFIYGKNLELFNVTEYANNNVTVLSTEESFSDAINYVKNTIEKAKFAISYDDESCVDIEATSRYNAILEFRKMYDEYSIIDEIDVLADWSE